MKSYVRALILFQSKRIIERSNLLSIKILISAIQSINFRRLSIYQWKSHWIPIYSIDGIV